MAISEQKSQELSNRVRELESRYESNNIPLWPLQVAGSRVDEFQLRSPNDNLAKQNFGRASHAIEQATSYANHYTAQRRDEQVQVTKIMRGKLERDTPTHYLLKESIGDITERLGIPTEIPTVVSDVDDVVQVKLLRDESYVKDQLYHLGNVSALDGNPLIVDFLEKGLGGPIKRATVKCSGIYAYNLLIVSGSLPSVIENAYALLQIEYTRQPIDKLENMANRLVNENRNFTEFLWRFAHKTSEPSASIYAGLLIYRLLEIQVTINKSIGFGSK